MALILIRKLGSRKEKTGKSYSGWGKYLCSFCFNIVERRMISSNKKRESCGCVTKELQSKANKGKIRSEEQKQRYSEAFKGKPKSEEHKQKLKDNHMDSSGENNGMYGKKHTEEAKQKIKETHAKNGLNKGENNPNYGKPHSEETKQKIRKAREKYIGVFASNWCGGVSFELYGLDFNKELKQFILERDNYTCQCPDCEYKSTKLDVHHIDYDKKNNNPENLIALCKSCHMKTNGKNIRQYWTKFYQNIMMGKLMECFL